MVQVTEKRQEIIKKLAQKYSLGLLLLFGSRVSGKTHKESDYDIGYLSTHELDLREEGELIGSLMPVLEVRDERFINLVNIKKVTPLLLYSMTSEYQLLYEREPALFAQLQAAAYKKYLELKPLYEAKSRRLGKLIKSL